MIARPVTIVITNHYQFTKNLAADRYKIGDCAYALRSNRHQVSGLVFFLRILSGLLDLFNEYCKFMRHLVHLRNGKDPLYLFVGELLVPHQPFIICGE